MHSDWLETALRGGDSAGILRLLIPEVKRNLACTAILITTVSLQFQPMPLLKRAAPFDDPDWLYELKYDGFRALAGIEHGRAQLLSRNGRIRRCIHGPWKANCGCTAECNSGHRRRNFFLDRLGRPRFTNLMFRRGNPPCFFAFDLLTYGKDLRTERLLDRKQELRRLLARACAPLKCTEYIDGCGMALFQRVCELDLEGVVAKQKFGPYVTEREHSTWFKIFESGIFTEGRQRRIVRA